jgi:uncharacterized membrane protein YeiH
MWDLTYLLSILATVVFSVTGVLAARGSHIDLFGVMVVGVVTAVGGGTIRDIILGVPVWWVVQPEYVAIAIAAAVATFAMPALLQKGYKALLYLDALGVALFATGAVASTLALELTYLHATVMGIISGIGGGIIRDLLTGRPTLVMSRDLYATPILLGIFLQLLLLSTGLVESHIALLLGGALIFCSRSAAIYWHLQMPSFLTLDRK